jgi:hypothetical protein
MIAVMYVPRVVGYVDMGKPAVVLYWPAYYFLGLAVFRWPLMGTRTILTFIRAYWVFFVGILTLMSMPNMYGRCDLDPPGFWLERLRFVFIEASLVIALVTGAFNTYDPWGVATWLNYWALFAFVFHWGFARMLPLPYGALLTYSTIFLFYVGCKLLQAREAKTGTCDISSADGSGAKATSQTMDGSFDGGAEGA